MRINFKSPYLYLGILDIIAFLRFVRFDNIFVEGDLFLTLIGLARFISPFIILAAGLLLLSNKIFLGRIVYFVSVPFKIAFILPTIPFVMMLFPSQEIGIIFHALVELFRIGYTLSRRGTNFKSA